METNTCSISGSICVVAVVSTKSGHIFEHETILKHLSTVDRCPITGIILLPSDLITIQEARENGIKLVYDDFSK
jgi:hypothetical protein